MGITQKNGVAGSTDGYSTFGKHSRWRAESEDLRPFRHAPNLSQLGANGNPGAVHFMHRYVIGDIKARTIIESRITPWLR
jgi:hypothetical protein